MITWRLFAMWCADLRARGLTGDIVWNSKKLTVVGMRLGLMKGFDNDNDN